MVPSLATAAPIAPIFPNIGQLPNPGSVTTGETTQTIIFGSNNIQIARYKSQIYKCLNSDLTHTLTCLIIATYQPLYDNNQYLDYALDSGDSLGMARFIDNFSDEHKESGAYFINGRGKHLQAVNMEKNIPVWLALEFEGPLTDVSSGRIVFRDKQAILHSHEISKQQ